MIKGWVDKVAQVGIMIQYCDTSGWSEEDFGRIPPILFSFRFIQENEGKPREKTKKKKRPRGMPSLVVV